MKKRNRIYLDYAASTPIDRAVAAAMAPYFTDKFGNSGSLHSFGQEALAAVDKSRAIVAKAVNADFREIIFTGSATEANNLALRGLVKGIMNKEPRLKNKAESGFIIRDSRFRTPRVIVSAIEHESVLETAKDLEREGVEVIHLPVNREGKVELERLKSSLNERTILVSVMHVNNEIGTIEPITEISDIIRNFRKDLVIKNKELRKDSKFTIHSSLFPLFHIDAVQALHYLDCDVQKLGIDLMTLSAHKVYGPKGIGALYIRNQEPVIRNNGFVIPITTGGGQEFGLRSGTENVSAIVGFGKAAELLMEEKKQRAKKIMELKNYFWRKLKKFSSHAAVNGPQPEDAVPHILNIYFPDQISQDLLIKLDMAGVAVSSGAACSVRASKPSRVLKALALPPERARGSVRFSFGKPTRREEINQVLKILERIL